MTSTIANFLEPICRRYGGAFRQAQDELRRIQGERNHQQEADEYIAQLTNYVREQLAASELPIADQTATELPAEHCWLFKSVLGTVNFARTLDNPCALFVYVKNNRPLVAAACFPGRDETVIASVGEGTAGKIRARASATDDLKNAVVHLPACKAEHLLPEVQAKLNAANVIIRNNGSSIASVVDFAAGKVDAVIMRGLPLVSKLAAELIAKEAGGTFYERADGTCVATTHQLKEQLEAVMS